MLKQLGFKDVPSSILFPIHEGSTSVVDHVISVHVTESSEDCELKCYLEDDCMSINIEPKGDGTYYYELSDSDHVLHPRDLTDQFISQSYYVRGCIQISFRTLSFPKARKK